MKRVQHREKNVTSVRPIVEPAPQNVKLEMDKCVSCDKETPYPKILHIGYRCYYMEGVGQLCKECYEKIYK